MRRPCAARGPCWRSSSSMSQINRSRVGSCSSHLGNRCIRPRGQSPQENSPAGSIRASQHAGCMCSSRGSVLRKGDWCSLGASVRLVHSSCAWSTILTCSSAVAELLEVRVKKILRALDEIKVPGSHSPLVSPLWVAVIPGMFLGPGHGVLQVLGFGGPLVT